jgi:predicted house-cleaning noncanonical NTP pyrophosphatase (MazG superfamily)
MTKEEFIKAVQFEEKQDPATGGIRHTAKIEFYSTIKQGANCEQPEYTKTLIKNKLIKELYNFIYDDKRQELGKAVDELLMYIEPKFFPDYNILAARDKILEICGFESGNRLIQDNEKVW